MLEIFKGKGLLNFLVLPVFAIGSFYDKRLAIGPVNFTIIFTIFFILAFFFLIQAEVNTLIKKHITGVFFLVIFLNALNWILWGINLDGNYSIGKFTTLILITMPICLFVTRFKTQEEVRIFLKQVPLVGLFLGLVGVAQLIVSGGASETRFAVLGGGPIVFSRWIGIFFIIFLFNVNLNIVVKTGILVTCLVLMALSGSKGPFYFLILTLVILLLRKKSILFFLAVAGLFVRFNLDYIKSYLSSNLMLVRLFGLSESSSVVSGSSSSARESPIIESLQTIQKNPFGYGMGNFSLYSDYSKVLGLSGYPHNIFIEIWLELGLIILIIVVLYFVILLNKSFTVLYLSNKHVSSTQKTVIGVWLFYFFNSLVSGDLSDARFLIVFSTLYFVLLAIANDFNKTRGQILINT